MNFYTSLGWTIRDRRCVELVKCFPFDYIYVFFGVWINKLLASEGKKGKINISQTVTYIVAVYSANWPFLSRAI
jgi:hypothetical protein